MDKTTAALHLRYSSELINT